jgi:aminoglycoside phosphotransferase (APT) family kinase protein
VDSGKLLASGRTADVYEIDAGRVLKRYTMDMPVGREVEAMRHAAAHGVPVPRVYASDESSITMERVPGPTMAAALVAGEVSLDETASTLARLHRRLHEIPPMLDRSQPTLIHLDLHPENVILSAAGPVIIDWANAVDGDGDLDVALTAVILAQVALEPSWADVRASELLPLFVAEADGELLRGLDEAVAMRLRNPTMSPVELERLPRAGDLVRNARRNALAS